MAELTATVAVMLTWRIGHTCLWQRRKMAEDVLVWVYLLVLWQPHITTVKSTNQQRSLTFFLHCQRSLTFFLRCQRSFPRSHGSLTRLLFALGLGSTFVSAKL